MSFAYDDLGNRVAQASKLAKYLFPAAVTNSSYNAANQQLTFGKYTMQYDTNGNVTNIISGATTNKLLWSSRNQLTGVVAAVSAAFQYDSLRRRITRTVAGVAEKYLYDGLDIVVQKDGANVINGRYFRGLGIDEPWQRGEGTIQYEAGPTTGLQGWWKMNEGTGTTANDASGNGNPGTLVNGTAWATGIASNAVNVDGSNDYINMGDKATLEGNATWTFATWINPDTFNTSRDTWLFYKQYVLQWGFLSGASRQQSVNIGDGNNTILQGATTNGVQLNASTWTHIAVTYSNSQVKFYVNGALTDTITKTYTMGSNAKAFSISTSTQSFDGKLDDVRYYNRALSAPEILQVYGSLVTNHLYLADALGSIVALTDTSRAITTEDDYEPFGATTTTGAGNKNSYKFTAREDDGTGLYYYRARYYHPALARFVSEDPIEFEGGDINLYAYVGSSPLSYGDPLGLWGIWIGKLKLGNDRPYWVFADSGRFGEVKIPDWQIRVQGGGYLGLGISGFLTSVLWPGPQTPALVQGSGFFFVAGGYQLCEGKSFPLTQWQFVSHPMLGQTLEIETGKQEK